MESELLESKEKILIEELCCGSTEEMLSISASDSVVLGVCMNSGCDYTTDVEPDCDDGHCEVCGTHTVKSPLMIFGLI
tara:strand:+ start:105 stop:338 length:234 start_codon:yes stop_codon:yes gene_type:complete